MLDMPTTPRAEAHQIPRTLPVGLLNKASQKTALLPKIRRVVFRPSTELLKLSHWIYRIQTLGNNEFGFGTVWIAGGSSRTILDHVYFKKPLKMRDLDLFFVAGCRENDSTAWKLAKRIDEEGIAEFKRPKIRAKSRVNPHLPKDEQLKYQAGYGLHFTHETFPILSLSIFHEAKDLELNGIMNVDKILIPLRAGQSLMDFATEELSRTPYFEIAEKGIITDPFQGYMAWLHKKPEILNWLSISVEPPMKSIRILRSFAKCGYSELPKEVQEQMGAMVKEAEAPTDPFEMMRSFLKILSDRLVAPQLKMLASIGTLHFLSPELQTSLEGLNVEAIEKKINKGKTMFTQGTEISDAMKSEPMQIFRAITEGLSVTTRNALLTKGLEAYPTTFTQT